jgi:hypothetical protein
MIIESMESVESLRSSADEAGTCDVDVDFIAASAIYMDDFYSFDISDPYHRHFILKILLYDDIYKKLCISDILNLGFSELEILTSIFS